MPAYREGKDIAAIENRPQLLPGLEFYLNGYMNLQADRPVGMSLGPIPWSSIVAWCQLNGIRQNDDIETIIGYFRTMEAAENKLRERKDAK